MMKNKKGIIGIAIIGIILLALIFAVLFITYLLSDKLISGLGSQWFLYIGVFILLIIFRQQFMVIFKTLWTYVIKYPWVILVILALFSAYRWLS